MNAPIKEKILTRRSVLIKNSRCTGVIRPNNQLGTSKKRKKSLFITSWRRVIQKLFKWPKFVHNILFTVMAVVDKSIDRAKPLTIC